MSADIDENLRSKLLKNARTIRKEDLVLAVFDLLDGASGPNEIVSNTGVSHERAVELRELYLTLTKEV